MKRSQILQSVQPFISKAPTFVTCAATSRELKHIGDQPNYIYLLDSMGLAISVATGYALTKRGQGHQQVYAIEGDGSLLMNPNSLFSSINQSLKNLTVLLIDNGVYGSTGEQATLSPQIDLGELAKTAGWRVARVESLKRLTRELEQGSGEGPRFLHVIASPGNLEGAPLVLDDPAALKSRFMEWDYRRATT